MTKWTKEQADFISAVEAGKSPLSLRAVAGAGKTTTLVGAVNAYAATAPFADVTCVAFNKKIADELGSRMDASVTCKTMNAVGHAAWSKRIDRRLQVSTRKTYANLKDLHGRDYRLPEGLGDVPKLVGLAKACGVVPRQYIGRAKQILAPDDDFVWDQILEHFDLMIPEEKQNKAIDLARRLLVKSIDDAFNGLIDFNDQLYMPVCFGGHWFKSDRVLIDEAQDISHIQREMLSNMLKASGYLISIGDPRQAIYGFRGAAADSMDRMAEEFLQVPMALTYTFRCSKAVTAEAQKLVPDIKCPESAVEGEVSQWDEWHLANIPSNAAIICRNTKPLIDIAFRLIHRRIPCFVLGRDIGAGLIRLIQSMKANDLMELSEKLEDYARFHIAKANRLGRPERAESVRDKVDTVHTIIDSMEETQPTIQQLTKQIEALFSNLRGGICLSTIHKAKGLEWDTVYFLDSHLIPSRFAIQDWQLEQEDNLRYVGITRAHNELVYVNSEGAR